jgi:hypothetical protein
MKQKFALVMGILLGFLILPSVSCAPGGGVWFQSGSVVLWKHTLSELTDEYDPGAPEWIQRRSTYIRFAAESVVSSDTEVSLTGAYYEHFGTLTPGPDYQNDPGFVAWHENRTYLVTTDTSSQYHGFWNSLDASMKDVTTMDSILMDSILITASIVWVDSNFLIYKNKTGDEVSGTNSTSIIKKADNYIAYKMTITRSMKLLGSYPYETKSWFNATAELTGLLKYGPKYHVLHTSSLNITYSKLTWNNNTKTHDAAQKQYMAELAAYYPTEINQDVDLMDEIGLSIPGYPIIGLVCAVVIGVIWIQKRRVVFHRI